MLGSWIQGESISKAGALVKVISNLITDYRDGAPRFSQRWASSLAFELSFAVSISLLLSNLLKFNTREALAGFSWGTHRRD
jgi:hypothetical protein